ncbi:hypothetical protein BKA58DRAFT_171295 [Alternaria rosae]|uniref:uncharacterized protein n=1 Tax=Alternaria rosae TaxID=1187941 RepID=UPI001E8DD5CA|nr:uncharacterized protein BKA58DRAFT_171295 [Alternaria rosae]KAH6870097.1 hypothetical protein BKA58DRAFT_171295 [Alternaria rosae]
MSSRPKRTSLQDRVREDLLYRLRWNVLAPLDDIKIRTGPGDSTTDVPLFEHYLANESIASPPFSRIDEVCVGEYLNRVDIRYEEHERYKPPPALTIDNANDSPITLGQFAKETHAYLNLHMEELKLAKGMLFGKPSGVTEDGIVIRTISDEPYSPPDIGFFFMHVAAIQIGKVVRFSTRVFAEGERWRTTDTFWATQLKQAHYREQLRKNPGMPVPSARSRVHDEDIQDALRQAYRE